MNILISVNLLSNFHHFCAFYISLIVSDAKIDCLSNELRKLKKLVEDLHSENQALVSLNADLVTLSAEYGNDRIRFTCKY